MRFGSKQSIDYHYSLSNTQTCGGKKSFPSYKLAAEFNNKIFSRGSAIRNKGKKIERLHPYKCKVCGNFHLGHEVRTRHIRLQRNRGNQSLRLR